MAQINGYKEELQDELQKTDPNSHASRLLAQEIERLEKGEDRKDSKSVAFIDVHPEQPQQVGLKVRIPIQEFPKFNFVGKLLGPKGNTLKRLQEETGCKMAILGKGSMRDKAKEDELRKEGGKFAHLNDELHVYVEAFAEMSDGYRRLSHAVSELKKFLVPNLQDLQEWPTQGQPPFAGPFFQPTWGAGLFSPMGPPPIFPPPFRARKKAAKAKAKQEIPEPKIRNPQPVWYSSIEKEHNELKRQRRVAERKWQKSKVLADRNAYIGVKRRITDLIRKAKFAFEGPSEYKKKKMKELAEKEKLETSAEGSENETSENVGTSSTTQSSHEEETVEGEGEGEGEDEDGSSLDDSLEAKTGDADSSQEGCVGFDVESLAKEDAAVVTEEETGVVEGMTTGELKVCGVDSVAGSDGSYGDCSLATDGGDGGQDTSQSQVLEGNDEIRQQQFQEMMYLNSGETPRGGGRGGAGGFRGARGGPPAGRGGPPAGRGAPRGGGGAPPPVRGAPRGGGGAPRGAGGAPRGSGAPMRGASRGRGGGAPPPPPQAASYDDYGYGSSSHAGSGAGGYDEGYDNRGYGESSYSSGGQGDGQYYGGGSYGSGSQSASAAYDDYNSYDYGHGESGYGHSESWGSNGSSGGGPMKSGRGGVAKPRSHPYSGGRGGY